ncbi:MAG: molybdopterin synthase catalytic subunit [Sphingomonas bacterium]|uniref:molybdenum cofactor biosynthesis protein MoaE n=1 Tax=Sphingomonas bacterium TaxID=1895847 RepID=UPI00262C3922|nr:molybdenum cofactor biosynthesis protein MoaE [Sphingomonas bacterium]MDB5704394.1 molybdopterin synthase catalytic subunit [Sphingomonas bacterium]
MIRVVIQHEAIDPAAAFAAITATGVGGIATFTGVVRADDGVGTLELEHYPGATEAALQRLAEEAVERWGLAAASVVHRVGVMQPGDLVVFVGTAATHRTAALDSCAFLIDRLKTDAPFWKRETRGDESRWVEPRDGDSIAAARWHKP